MPTAAIGVALKEGPGADLGQIARDLLAMNSDKVTGIFKRRLEAAAAPFVPAVRASVLAIPVEPAPARHTGLRLKIAACAEVDSWRDRNDVSVRVWMNPERMIRPTEYTLPLYMQGAIGAGRGKNYTRWRHPVFGHRDQPWVQQPAHPYFYQAVAPLRLQAEIAVRAAVDEITRDLSG